MNLVHEPVSKYSPRVTKILAKGYEMTTSEYKYLIKRGLTVEEISEVTKIPVTELPGEDGGLDVDTYKALSEQGWSDRKIGRKFDMGNTKFWEWKVRNGLKEFVVDGLDKEAFINYKKQGWKDADIAKKHKIGSTAMKLWKDLNLSTEEQKQLLLSSGMYGRKSS